MSYVPSAADTATVAFATGYLAPAADAVALALRDPDPVPPAPTRYLGSGAALPWRPKPVVSRTVRAASRFAPLRARDTPTSWTAAAARTTGLGFAWSSVPAAVAETALLWSRSGGVPATSVVLPWSVLPHAVRGVAATWTVPPIVHGATNVKWIAPVGRVASFAAVWGLPPAVAAAHALRWLGPPDVCRQWGLPWGFAPPVRWVVHGPGVEPPIEPPHGGYVAPAGDAVAVNFLCPVAVFDGDAAIVPLGPAACYWAWPRQRTYVVLNSVQVVRLPERTPIAVKSIQIRSSVDDVVWSFSLELADPGHVSYLLKDADGPKAIEINVNGYVWTAIVDARQEDRRHAARAVTVSARSRTAVLDAPYAPVRSHVQPADRQAQQLVDEELALTGFSATYDTLTWLVPGGVWHYDGKTPLDAVRSIAAGVGAVVQSHPWDLSVRVAPRYPVSPWNWLTTAPDKRIQDDVILSIGARNQSKPLHDYVLVSGDQVGVSDPIIRTGSAGEVRAPMVVDPLITTHAASLERGRNVLCDRGEQDAIDIVIPLFPASAIDQAGLVLPLQLVEVVEPSAWKGLAIAVDINVQTVGDKALVIEQTVSIARHYSDAN